MSPTEAPLAADGPAPAVPRAAKAFEGVHWGLSAFNALAPRDPAQQVVSGAAYGPLTRQRLDVYRPRRLEAPAPVVVFFYGGSWDSGRRQDYAFVGRALAAQGFVVAVPDYRLYPQVRFPAFMDDGAAAVRWVRDHAADWGGDPSRILLAGHSAGAYIAVMLGLDRRFLKSEGVDPRAIKAVGGLSGPYYFLPLDAKATIASFGGHGDLEATQPANHVAAESPPMFLGHGGRDGLVRPGNAVNLGKALRRAGVPAEVRVYPRLDHAGPLLALSRPFRGRAPVLTEMSGFLMAQAG